MSRIFAFEKWQLIIIAMETYRLMQVDLVVSYLFSALTPVFELMRAYEAEGLLRLKEAIKFPYISKMPYDPNEQTEFNGQILLAHECFYEYRESTEFIALIDWDDLLITTNFNNLAESFIVAKQNFPNSAYYLVNKLESTFYEQSKY